MMKKYIVTFFTTVFCCIFLCLIVNFIPKEAIQTNCENSAEHFSRKSLFNEVLNGQKNTTTDNYADCILLNIIYCMDSSQPIKALMDAGYYSREKTDVHYSFMEAVYQNREANTSYARYWHGSMVLLRPLLCVTDITGIKWILGSCTLLCIVATAVILWRKKEYLLMFSYIAGLFLIRAWVTVLCIEYLMSMLLMSVIVLLFVRIMTSSDDLTMTFLCFGKKQIYFKREDLLLFISMIAGILVCFTDFLTIETVTITVPLFFYYALCNTKEAEMCDGDGLFKIKSQFNFGIKALLLWGIGYVGMFFTKWILSILFLGKDSLTSVLELSTERINGNPLKAVYNNITALFPIAAPESVAGYMCFAIASVIAIIGIVLLLKDIKNSDLCKRTHGIIMLILFGIPFLRFAVISQHSQQHYFFTYRALLISILVILWYLSRNFFVLSSTKIDKK